MDVIIVDNDREVSGVEVSTIAGSLPIGSSAKVTTKDASSIRRPVTSSGTRKVDGVWIETVKVLRIRKAYVDSVCPIAKTAYVYYDDDVYDSALTEKSTGVTYVTQLIFDNATKVYYVYHRWGDSSYELEGPYETIDSAKETFQVTYKEKFDFEWTERESATSERWTYEVKTYETFQEMEEVEKAVDETVPKVFIPHEELAVDEQTSSWFSRIAPCAAVIEVDAVCEKMPPAGGKKGGSAGLSPVAIAAVMDASRM